LVIAENLMPMNKTEGQLRDPKAETLIRETTTGRPDASYSLVQTVLIQDLSLHNAQSRITDLETQLTETKRASSAPPSFLGGPSFLGAVFGQGEPSGGVQTSSVPPSGPGDRLSARRDAAVGLCPPTELRGTFRF
jgi:uncharacterized protein